jgi:ABC-2 type transport system ATP-binding protein
MNYIFANSGSASIFGLDCQKNSSEIKKNVGYLPSEVNYYDDMKVFELLKYSAKYYKKDCSKKINELCDYFLVDKNKTIDELSLGNKKKIAIIQSLLHSPDLLILDEPTSGLDPLMQNKFFNLLKEENKKGVTIFFSSHILTEVQKMCDRVGIIKDGRILKVEQVENLQDDRYKKIKLELKNKNYDFKLDDGEMTNFVKNNGMIEFLYSGDLNKIVKNISSLEVDNIWIEDPTLEEIFMNYYKEGEK